MSATEVEILGDGAFAGSIANIVEYSSEEYGSPLSMTDLSGGVANVNFSVIEDTSFDGSILLPGQDFMLRDPHAGNQSGVIDSVLSNDSFGLSVQGNGRLMLLVCEREAAAFSGTLGQALIYYFSLCGITSGFQFDADITGARVDLPYWVGDVWTQVKKLMAIHQFEIAEVAGVIVIRKLRLRWVDVERYMSEGVNYGRTQASQAVEVHYYNNEWKVDHQVYPNPETAIVDRQMLTVDAGETSVTNYAVDMWLSEIDEPTHVLALPWDNTSATSVYSVVDKDGVSVSIQDWANGGGLVSFEIGEDHKSVDVTVRGMITQSRAPYRLASPSPDGEYQYPALYIAAKGVAFRDELVWSATGEDLLTAPADQVTVVDDPMVSTREEALVVLANAVRKESGFLQELEVSTTAINRRGETGQQMFPTFGEFDDMLPFDYTFENFDTDYSGWTFSHFTNAMASIHARDFANQALGGIGGARVRHRDNIYRITRGTSRPGEFGWNAEPDLLFEEWDELSEDAPLTFGDFDDKWTGKTFEQHARMPLISLPRRIVNLVTNPSFEDGSGVVEVRRNLFTDPAVVSVSSFGINAAQGIASHAGSEARFTLVTSAAVGIGFNSTLETGSAYRVLFRARANRPLVAKTRVRNASSPTYTIGTDWAWFDHTVTASSGSNGQTGILLDTGAGHAVDDWVEVDRVLIALGGDRGGWFDGGFSPDSDLTPSWVGALDGSASILTGVPVAGVTAVNCVAIRSTQWAKAGSHSMRLIPNTTSNNSYAEIAPAPLPLGVVHTALATKHQKSVITGALHASAFALQFASPLAVVVQGSNTVGYQELRGSGSTTTQGRFILRHGGSQGSGDVWWDCAALVEGIYDGPWFAGSTRP